MLGIVVSKADPASVAIGEACRRVADWERDTDATSSPADGGGTVYRRPGVAMRTVDELHLRTTDVAERFDVAPDLLVFASKHAGETGPLLTAHHTGNVGPADHGGRANELARACPNALQAVLGALDEHAPPAYDVGIEATHHGPSAVGAPSMFVEVGSAPVQWRDDAAAEAVARAILSLVDVDPHRPTAGGRRRQLVGIGGGHYAPRFERILRETDWAVGHVAPDWALERLGDVRGHRRVLARLVARSWADYALVAGERPALEAAVAEAGYRVVTERWVRATTGVPLDRVARLEAALGTVDRGLRFGAPARAALDGWTTVALGGELVEAANGIDQERTRDAVASHAVAFDTVDNGARPTGRLAVPNDDAVGPIVGALIDVLSTKFDAVECDDESVVARRERFDPELAREHNVPEGPAYGRLADGESVTVDGETVEPSAVSRVERHRFPILADAASPASADD